jgi:hypothetical protein
MGRVRQSGRQADWQTVTGSCFRVPACPFASLPVAMLIRVMLRATLLLIFLLVPSYAHASEKILCSFYYMDKYHDEVNKLPGSKDKLKHCALSCMVARKCPSFEVEVVGILKEIYDLIGPGNPELDDIEANRRGISFAPIAKKRSDCFRFCKQIY